MLTKPLERYFEAFSFPRTYCKNDRYGIQIFLAVKVFFIDEGHSCHSIKTGPGFASWAGQTSDEYLLTGLGFETRPYRGIKAFPPNEESNNGCITSLYYINVNIDASGLHLNAIMS